MEPEKFELEILCLKGENNSFLEKIKKLALQNNGEVRSEKEDGNKTSIEFTFNNIEDRDFFREISALVIAQYHSLSCDVQTPEDQVDARIFPDGIYHHLRFEDEYSAWRCANMLTAVFSIYSPDESYDVSVVRVENEEDEYLVVFGFPFESVILMPEEIEEFIDSLSEDESDIATFPLSKNKGELN